MGMTVIKMQIANVAKPTKTEAIKLLVDSGAVYSVVPTRILQRLKIKPIATEEFQLADGRTITRRKGGAVFRYKDRVGVADVIFGEEGDSNLLGAFTLEALGLSLDPLKRELNPLPMMLATLLHAPRQPSVDWAQGDEK
jgi:predicted aspartyl protease